MSAQAKHPSTWSTRARGPRWRARRAGIGGRAILFFHKTPIFGIENLGIYKLVPGFFLVILTWCCGGAM